MLKMTEEKETFWTLYVGAVVNCSAAASGSFQYFYRRRKREEKSFLHRYMFVSRAVPLLVSHWGEPCSGRLSLLV